MEHHILHSALLVLTSSLFTASASAQVIACGQATSLVVCSDGSSMSWGFGIYGALGNGTNTTTNVPGPIGMLTDVVGVSGGSGHSLAVKGDGTAWAWGQNGYGELGNGGGPNSNLPVQVSGLTDAVFVAGGEGFSAALKSNGTVCGWGLNQSGELGDGTGTNNATPVVASGLTDVLTIRAGRRHVMALKSDGTVWTWGSGSSGQLGIGTVANSLVPVQVPSLTGITAIAPGGLQSYALKNDGTLWAWGNNQNGQLGIGTSGFGTNSNVPVQVTALSDVVLIAAGWDHALALKNDGTLWSWGYNAFGQLGNGNFAPSSVPVAVIAPAGITALAGGGMAHSLALLDDGSLWAWGNNGEGELGNGNFNNSTATIEVIGECVLATGVEEIVDATSVEVFPNPTTGRFTLQGTIAGTQLEIHDALGQEVLRSTVDGPSSEIDLSTQPDGIYFMTIMTADGIIARRVIKE